MNNYMNLSEYETKSVIQNMLRESGKESLASVAREIGLKETTFRSALNNDSIRIRDFLKVAELMGYEIIVKKI